MKEKHKDDPMFKLGYWAGWKDGLAAQEAQPAPAREARLLALLIEAHEVVGYRPNSDWYERVSLERMAAALTGDTPKIEGPIEPADLVGLTPAQVYRRGWEDGYTARSTGDTR